MNREADIDELTIRLEMACRTIDKEISQYKNISVDEYKKFVNQKIDKIVKSFIGKLKSNINNQSLYSIAELYKLKCLKDFQNKKLDQQ